MQNKLFNLVFPTWIIIANPFTGIPLLFINYFLDRFIYWVVLKNDKVYVENRESFNNTVLYAFYVGLTVDFIGLVFLWLTKGLEYSRFGEWIGQEVIFSLLICGLIIFYSNYRLALTKLKLTKKIAIMLGFFMGIITTPWFFYSPHITA